MIEPDEERLAADADEAALDEFQRSGRRPTINDIARLSRVSKKTVSRIINLSPFVKDETRARVMKVIDALSYMPDLQARGLAFRRSFLVGLIYNNPSAQYVIDMQQGILDAVRGSGFELVVHPCDLSNPNFLKDVRAFVERQKLFGVIMPPSVSEDAALAELLTEIDCPYVRIASVTLDRGPAMIVTNDRVGASEAARHLADLGHRRIAFVSGPTSFRSSHERRKGFAAGLAEKGLKLAADDVVFGAYTFESGVACGKALLTRKPRPTAVFCGNDEMAAGVYRAARDLGFDIPRDLSIVGYDDSPVAAKVWPTLTTVKLPIRQMGRSAAEKLLSGAVEGFAKQPPDEGQFTPALVVRESTAPPAKA